MFNWWQLFFHGCLILLLSLGLIIAKATEWPRILICKAAYRVTVMHTAWQTRDWPTMESAHFRLCYQPEDASVAEIVLDSAEAIYEPSVELLQCKPRGKSMIILHGDQDSLARQFGWTAGESAMGVYWNGVIRILSPHSWVQSNDLKVISRSFNTTGPMAHEYAHLLVDCKAGGNYPRWLTEGIAQYIERQLIGFAMPVPAEVGDWYSLADMDRGFDGLPDQSLAYFQSYKVVDYLVQQWGWPSLLQLLDCLGRGIPLGKALQQTLNIEAKDLEVIFAEPAY